MWRALETKGQWFGATLERDAAGHEFIMTARRRAGPVYPDWRYDMEKRVQEMDRRQVDVQAVCPAPFLTNYHLDPKEALESSRQVNDEIASMVSARPQRFVGLATVPLQDPKASVKELERAMALPGFKGVEICTNVDGRNLDDPSLEPFYRAAEESSAFVFVHPHSPAASKRTARYYLGNLIGNPLDTTIAIASLIFGGVLDRHPDLKLCFAHGGGYACFGIGRFDHGFGVRPEPRQVLKKLPSSYLKGLYYDCITHSPEALRYLVQTVGIDRVLLGTDYPFDMGYASPVEWVNSLAGFSQEEKEMILGENAGKLLGLS